MSTGLTNTQTARGFCITYSLKNNAFSVLHYVITEMAVFTLEKDYSREEGYPFDDSRQIGNTS